jgi:hypothetical protein
MRRKLWIAISTSVLALAFFLVGSPAAHALGSEVLGCAFDSGAWTANACDGGGISGVNNTVHFAAHNLTGTYSMTWTVMKPGGVTASNCLPGYVDCISSGCTATSTTCDIRVHSGNFDRTFTTTLKMTQSGWVKTLQAQALVFGTESRCSTC